MPAARRLHMPSAKKPDEDRIHQAFFSLGRQAAALGAIFFINFLPLVTHV